MSVRVAVYTSCIRKLGCLLTGEKAPNVYVHTPILNKKKKNLAALVYNLDFTNCAIPSVDSIFACSTSLSKSTKSLGTFDSSSL